jgi:hypothetical protein
MKNSISEVRYEVRALSPAEATIWFTVVAEHMTSTTEVRGRVVGPRCSSRTTIEISYPLQRIPYAPEGTPPLAIRAIIPDPACWEPDAPFLYHADVELWQDGEPCGRKEFDLGLRMRT